MSHYTTEVRFICENAAGLTESEGLSNVAEIIEKARTSIFDFSFPIFDENYRSVIETKILKHYYTREIGFETVGVWKLKLDTKLNEIMPYYNKLYNSELVEFNPFYDVDYYTKRDDSYKFDEKSSAEGTSNNTRTDNLTHRNLYSDTPQGALNGVESEAYLTDASKDTDTGTVNNSGNTTGNGTRNYTNIDDYLEHVYGKRGSATYSQLLQEYRKTFLNIDTMIIDDLSELFLNVW